jgi:hypothetical protein
MFQGRVLELFLELKLIDMANDPTPSKFQQVQGVRYCDPENQKHEDSENETSEDEIKKA